MHHGLKKFIGGCFAVVLLLPILALSKSDRTLSWQDLAPPAKDLRAPFAHLKEELLYDLNRLYSLNRWQKEGKIEEGSELEKEADELRANLKAANQDVDDLLKKIDHAMAEFEKQQSTPVADLDGETVRIPGYVLPLEFGGDAVSEFFLVPYVGACIHTPPPPANQIVLVKLNQSYKVKNLYDAVWVTGKLTIAKHDRELGYRDGAGKVTTTYELAGTAVVPYE